MDAIRYFEEKKRMLNSLGRKSGRCDGLDCYDCPFSRFNNERKLQCSAFELEYPEEAVAIVEKWAEEHPQKTILMDFLEKFPDAHEPEIMRNLCVRHLGYEPCKNCAIDNVDCAICWNRPIE